MGATTKGGQQLNEIQYAIKTRKQKGWFLDLASFESAVENIAVGYVYNYYSEFCISFVFKSKVWFAKYSRANTKMPIIGCSTNTIKY